MSVQCGCVILYRMVRSPSFNWLYYKERFDVFHKGRSAIISAVCWCFVGSVMGELNSMLIKFVDALFMDKLVFTRHSKSAGQFTGDLNCLFSQLFHLKNLKSSLR